jgi:hypothetical protein
MARPLVLPDIVGMTALTGPQGTLGRMATTIALPIPGYFGASRESARGPWNSQAFISIRLLIDQSSSRSFSRLT